MTGFEARVRRADGNVCWVSINARTVRNSSGEPVNYEGFMTDITDRKQAEAELARHRQHLEDMVKERTAELEIKVAALIKQGKSTKGIAEILGLAASSIDTHRENIRGKLDSSNRKENIQSYLQSIGYWGM